MKLIIPKGATSQLVSIFIQDSSKTDGSGLTGLTQASASLVCYRHRSDDGNANAVALSLISGTRGTWLSGSFKEKDATNMPGVYELGLDNNGLATGSNWVLYMLKGATNMAPVLLEIQLSAVDLTDGVRAGLTALPNVASGSAGAIPTTGTGANQINVDGAGAVDANTKKWSGTTVKTPAVAGVPVVDVSMWYGGQVPAPNVTGVPLIDAKYLLGTIFVTPAVAGIVDVNVKKFNNVTAPSLPTNFTSMGIDSNGRVQIQSAPNKNVALSNFEFVMVDSTGLPKTGLTITATRSIDGGGFGACTNAATEIGNGVYSINLSAADLNGNVISLRFTASGANDSLVTLTTNA